LFTASFGNIFIKPVIAYRSLVDELHDLDIFPCLFDVFQIMNPSSRHRFLDSVLAFVTGIII